MQQNFDIIVIKIGLGFEFKLGCLQSFSHSRNFADGIEFLKNFGKESRQFCLITSDAIIKMTVNTVVISIVRA